jgi:predicted enzyme involved in methoxymalonyl-ACP biosynthesis
LDFARTNALDELVRRRHGAAAPEGLPTKPVRLAILGASTLTHLHAPIRVGGLPRNIWVETYEYDYGQYFAGIA